MSLNQDGAEVILPEVVTLIGPGRLNVREGLEGDSWKGRRSSRTTDGSPHPDMQITLMNSRAADLITGSKAHWPLAGDQFFVDLDLGYKNLPPGTVLMIGDGADPTSGAVLLEITSQPHRGCGKFSKRFGSDALRFVNSPGGLDVNARGIYARVLQPGTITVGSRIRKLGQASFSEK